MISFAKIMKSDENYAGQTSDSLYFYTPRIDFLVEFIKIFSHFNLFAMSKDVYFRGGIAQGKLHYKEKYQFYGDSVIYAYLLENVIAKNPAVYVDEKTYQELVKNVDCSEWIEENKNRYYIKPFCGYNLEIKDCFNLDSLIDIQMISLETIYQNIEENRKKFEYDDKTFSKYLFLKEEFNNTVRKGEGDNNG